MKIVESIRLAMKALAANKLRAALTMLGIIIGVGAVITLMSVGEGVQAYITRAISIHRHQSVLHYPGFL